MSRKTRRNPLKNSLKRARAAAGRSPYVTLGLSGLTIGSMTFAGSVFAQDAGQTPSTGNPPPNSDQLQEVVVTGIRASLQKSLDIKENAIGVVDAISDEDIGQFPDASLGEAMQRIPGVTVDRGATSSTGGAPVSVGNASGVTIRGLGSSFNETLLDGRPMASAGTGSYAFDYASLGTDFVSEIDVLKTPDFSLSSGDIGGTVNIKLPTPFDHPGPQARAFVSSTDSTNDGQFTPAYGVLASDTFFDNKVGILIDGDYTDQKDFENHLDIAGWEGTYLNSCQMSGGPTCTSSTGVPLAQPYSQVTDNLSESTTPKNTVPSWFIQDYALYADRTDDRRKDGRLVIQFHPTDATMVTVDDTYSDDRLLAYRSEYSVWFNSTALNNVTTDGNGTITDFDYGPEPTDFDADYDGSYIKNNEFGLNVVWSPSDSWTGELDADQSASWLNPGQQLSNLDSDIGYGPSTAAAGATNGWYGGVVVPGGNGLPYLSSYGPNNDEGNVLGTNPYILGSHVFPIQQANSSDYINQVKLDAAWRPDNDTKLEFGAQLVEDTRNSWEQDTFTNNAWQLWGGYGPLSNNPAGHGQALPASLFGASISTANFLPGWSNNSQLPSSILEFNPYSVLNYLVSLGQAGANPGTIGAGYPPYTGGYPSLVLSPGSVAFIQQKTYSPFVTLEHTFNLGGMPLKADLGLRDERTQAETGGLETPLESLTVDPSDHTAFDFNLGPSTFTTQSNDYNYFLPSLDLNLMALPNLKIRFDASRTLTQPPLSYITPTLSETGRVGALTATGNNPQLLPYLSNNFDLGGEWYYGANDYVSVDGYFKHVSQFPELETNIVTINGVIDPTTGQLAQFAETTYENGPTANVDGVEVTWQQMLWNSGFGYQANGNIIHTNKTYNPYIYTNQFALPGIGDSVNFVGFYQNRGFQARLAVNWQATQFLAFGQQQNNSATGTEPTFLEGSTEVDFSMSYDIDSHVSVFFEALNLNDAEYVTHGRFDNQLLDVIDYGRSFTMGVRAKL